MKLVMDTNVLVSAFLWSGTPAGLLDYVTENGFSFYTSDVLLDELSKLLHSPKLAKTIAASGLEADGYFYRYQQMAMSVPSRKLTRQVCRDADDDHVLACALAAKADLIVTGDKDLLVLHPWRAVHILSPAAALNTLKRIR